MLIMLIYPLHWAHQVWGTVAVGADSSEGGWCMGGTGNRDNSCVISMAQTSPRTSQEWIAQRHLSLLWPTVPHPVK
jgi:hypothetical protein